MNPHKFAFFVYIGKIYRFKINTNKHIEQSLLPYSAFIFAVKVFRSKYSHYFLKTSRKTFLNA